MLGLGSVIGTGIFVLTGSQAATMAGPGIVFSFLLSGAFCLLIAFCYGELASALPSAGSAYAYTYVSMGRFVGWVTGLLMLLAYGLATAIVAVGWSAYVVSVLTDIGVPVPEAFMNAPGTPDGSVGVVNLFALIGVGGTTVLLCAGISATSAVNNVLTLFKVGAVVAFIVFGLQYVDPENWIPVIPPPDPAPAPGASAVSEIVRALVESVTHTRTSAFGIGGVVAASLVTFFGLLGFEMPSTAGEEARTPRSVPLAMIATVIICVILYAGTSIVMTGIVPYTQLSSPAPMAVALDAVGAPGAGFAIKLAAIAGLSTVMLTLLYAQTRVFLAMTRDGLMPPIFARLNDAGVPAAGTLATGAVVAAVAGFVPVYALSELTSVGMVGVFFLVCLAVLVLRSNSPHLDRPFKTPLFPIVPIIGMIGCGYLLLTVISPSTLVQLLVFFAFGLALFFISGAWRSAALAAQSGRSFEASAPRAPEMPAPRVAVAPRPEAPPQPTAQPAPPPVVQPAPPPVVQPTPVRPPPRPPPPRVAAAPRGGAKKPSATPTDVSDVFISYKREEKERVEGIAQALRSLKLKVWFDANLTPGHDFEEEINREVRSAKTVFVCWSERAVPSRWVRAEADMGFKRNVLVACFLEACDPWTPYNLVHAEDLSGTVLDGDNQAWVKLVQRIGEQAGRPGLAAYLRLGDDRAAMAAWLKDYPNDPLAEDVAAWLA